MQKIILGGVSLAGVVLFAGGLAALLGFTAHGDCADGELRAEYFANPDLEGEPILTRCEPGIDMDWEFGRPTADDDDGMGSDQGSSSLPEDGFSVRWRGDVEFAEGDYILTAGSDDGMRVWIDDRLVIDRWDIGPYAEETAELALGGIHSVRVDYYEDAGTAAARIAWAPVK